MPIIGGAKYSYEYRNLNWDTATDVPVDPIVINTWYTALLPTRNVKAYYLVVEQTNTGAAAEDIVVELTIDGTVYTRAVNRASGVPMYMHMNQYNALDYQTDIRQMMSLDIDQSAPLECKSLGIRVRQTSAVDITSAIIEVNMVYATKEVG